MKGLVLTGGNGPDFKLAGIRLEDYSIIVAADSGLDLAEKNGIMPDYVIGDMDSLSDKALLEKFSDDKILRYSKDKDYTDTELALTFLYDKNIDEITLAGGGGGRLDHLLGILSIFDRELKPDHWYTDKEHIICIKDRFKLGTEIGCQISFFPAGLNECRMKTKGLKWPLDGFCWTKGNAGISNIAKKNIVEVEMLSGILLMIYNYRKD